MHIREAACTFVKTLINGGCHMRMMCEAVCVTNAHMVLEARLVSSCLSLPSSARPLFSRLLLSVGVSVYTLQNVELDDT